MTASGDEENLFAWRIELLRDAGFSDPLAGSLARDTRYDLHGLLELTDRGCPAELAARILAPLDSEPDAPLYPGSTTPLDSTRRPPRTC